MRGQKEKTASWWLANIPGWGAVRIHQILKLLGSPEAVWNQVNQAARDHVGPDAFWEELQRRSVSQLWQEGMDQPWGRWIITGENIAALLQSVPEYERSREAYERWIESGGGFVTWEDQAYPDRLRPYPDCPFALYYRGRLPEEKRGSAAVIGARACSQYGRRYARSYARELAANGIQIISGLAYGIDSEGHLGALESGVRGSTWAVMGGGPDVCYPKEHESLYDRILDQGGGILSEYAPGVRPLPRHFPMRNRIISGLSDCVLVMEARRKSGSLITVDLALDQGKEVFALPGRVGDALSEGCLQLIEGGAGILTDCREVLRCVGMRHPEEKRPKTEDGGDSGGQHDRGDAANQIPVRTAGSRAMGLVWDALEEGGQSTEELLTRTGLSLSEVREVILELLLEDRIEEVTVGYYLRKNLRP